MNRDTINIKDGNESKYPLVYTVSKVTSDYSFDLRVMAKDEKTFNEVMEYFGG